MSCGVESLDTNLQTQASQDMRHKANAVFVLAPVDTPRFALVSATLLGRLAIAREYQGQGLGSVLLVRALRKADESAATVGSCVAVVDAIDDGAVRFYEAHGFVRLPDSARLVLAIRQIGRMVEGGSDGR